MGLESDLNSLMQDIVATNNSASEGATALLSQATVVRVELEVWSSEGETAFVIEFSDGSKFQCPGEGFFSGPVADLVRMAGGKPMTDQEEE